MALVQSQLCIRCCRPGHRAVDCKVSFYRTCNYCKEVGHEAKACQKLRESQARAEARAARREREASEARSESDCSTTASSAESLASLGKAGPRRSAQKQTQLWQPSHWVLSESEEREARKLEKKLREIAVLERLRDEGKQLEPLQLQKIERKSELENHDVLRKVRLGYHRVQLATVAE
mmetsp:Transcript_32396/g.61002  ORF Transcript_32396/g.61002 Transcript_32396/m.61002 type:complete len:178 (+) Transcript_32396:69-602(+)